MEARRLAEALARMSGLRVDLRVELSLAGRTQSPRPLPVPVRIGGFGGAAGLADYLRQGGFQALVDATHPYAARISANAAAAAQATGIPLYSLHRPGWARQAGDEWVEVADIPAGVAALGDKPSRVFVTLGRQEVAPLLAAPWHHYLIRSVDPIDPPLPLPHLETLLDRGPFDLAAEIDLLTRARIDIILSKNSGGDGAAAKIDAARLLGLPVIMVQRPHKPAGLLASDVPGLLTLLGLGAGGHDAAMLRGV